MKIKYETATGTVEIDVEDKWANILIEMDRQEYNNDHAETRRHCSLDALDPEEDTLPSCADVEGKLIMKERNNALYSAIRKLSPEQQRLIYQVYFEGRSFEEISASEGRHRSSTSRAAKRILKKIKKFL